MNRKDYKRMYVWNGENGPKYPSIRIVLWKEDSYCVAVEHSSERAFLRNETFTPYTWEHYEEITEPKMRPMTRNELVGFVTWNQHIVFRDVDHVVSPIFAFTNFNCGYKYEWSTIAEDGTTGEWRRFDKDVSDENN